MSDPAPGAAVTGSPTVARLQTELIHRLLAAGIDSPLPETRALLTHVLRLDWSGLVLAGSRILTPAETAQLEALTLRRLTREPLQHLLGSVDWGGVTLHVSPAALIPRPETEVLLQLALDALSGLNAPAVLDVGTGSGALALGLAAARPDARVSASDVSAGALALARKNADANSLTVNFLHSDLLEAVSGRYDLIVSNPPYLPESDRQEAQPEVRHDPELALYSGPDGLGLARRLVIQASGHLATGGRLLLELDPRNVDLLAGEMRLAGWAAEVEVDLAGRRRFVVAGR